MGTFLSRIFTQRLQSIINIQGIHSKIRIPDTVIEFIITTFQRFNSDVNYLEIRAALSRALAMVKENIRKAHKRKNEKDKKSDESFKQKSEDETSSKVVKKKTKLQSKPTMPAPSVMNTSSRISKGGQAGTSGMVSSSNKKKNVSSLLSESDDESSD